MGFLWSVEALTSSRRTATSIGSERRGPRRCWQHCRRGATPCPGIQEDYRTQTESLTAQLADEGFCVRYVGEIDGHPGAHGVSRMAESMVEIATSSRPAAAQAHCLAHELAHVLLHRAVDYRSERGRYEVEAESVAYLVSSAFGQEADATSVGYVTSWAAGDPEVVLQTAATVQRCARAIIDRALPSAPDGPAEAA